MTLPWREEKHHMPDAVDMQRVVDGLATTSARIRALDAAGYARADIARFLGKRYQHVRNVLLQEPPRSGAAHADSGPTREPGDVEPQRLRIAANGRLVIPADMRSAMLIDDSGHLTARVVRGELRVLAPRAAVRNLQKMMRDALPAGVSVVDELIAERRADAQREDGE